MSELIELELKIKALLDYELSKGVNVYAKNHVHSLDRNDIFVSVADQLGVHKVMVRKVAKKLMVEYIDKLAILQQYGKHNLRDIQKGISDEKIRI